MTRIILTVEVFKKSLLNLKGKSVNALFYSKSLRVSQKKA